MVVSITQIYRFLSRTAAVLVIAGILWAASSAAGSWLESSAKDPLPNTSNAANHDPTSVVAWHFMERGLEQFYTAGP